MIVGLVMLAMTIALIMTNHFSPANKPLPPSLTETSPERLPPDPNKPNGADVRYTDVHVFGLVGGKREKPQR